MDFGKLIMGGLNYAANSFTGYLIALGVISGLTMALLQCAKELTQWRANFNRTKLLEWLDARVKALHLRDAAAPKLQVAEAEKELLRLATDNNLDAFYGGDLDALSTQFSSAAQLVLDYPKLSRELYLLLTVHATGEDAQFLLGEYQPIIPIPGIAERQYSIEQLTASAEQRHKITETRNRIRHQVTQSIASFQSSASSQWQKKLKIYSWVVSAGLTMIAFVLSKVEWNQIGWVILLSAVSGFLAPVARDVLAALQRLRG